MISAIIMASGYSSRMGKNKLLLPFRGKTIIENVLDIVNNCEFDDIVLVAQEEIVLEMASTRNIKSVKNEAAYLGQSNSIKLGIKSSKEVEGYAFFTADQPLIDTMNINMLVNSFNNNVNSIIVPVFGEKRGTPVIFSSNYKTELMELEGDTGGRVIIAKHRAEVIYKEVSSERFVMDIDCVEDYRRLLTLDNNRFS